MKDQNYIHLFLEEQYNKVLSDPYAFIKNDPVQFPRHFFERGEDENEILLSAIITAWFSFGNRKAFLQKVEKIHTEMLNRSGSLRKYITDHEYVCYATDEKSIYRMFKGRYFYQLCCCLETLLQASENNVNQQLRTLLPSLFCFHPGDYHCFGKPDTVNKRFHMLLRWLVRKDAIDIGIWNQTGTETLLIPLDTHVSKIAGQIWGDLPRSESLRKVKVITERLRLLDPVDPVKYDFSLFCMGLEKISFPVNR